MKSIDTERSIFLRFGDYIQRKGHMDKEMDSRQVKNLKTNSIYLTFDFCPSSELDTDVINWLIDNKVKATFFICAKWMKMNSRKGLPLLDNSLFTIGGHGFHHIDPLEQSDEEQIEDIDLAIEYWKKRKKDIRWYRVPFGHPTDPALQLFHKLGIRCASWSGPVLDKKELKAKKDTYDKATEYLSNFLKAGDLYACHANGEGHRTVEILDYIKNLVDSKGLSFDKL